MGSYFILQLYTNMNLIFSQQILGSSLPLPAHGWVGARATLLFSAAHFAKQNTNSVGVQSEGEAEGGWGGNSASPEPKRSPAALLAQSRAAGRSVSFAQRNFAQSLEYPTNRNFRRFGKGLPRGFAARHSGFAPCAKPKNPTAGKKKRKWICLFRI